MQDELVRKLFTARDVVLSTHRNSDGDGIGSQIALFHALKKTGRRVRMINVDQPPKKYAFLEGFNDIEVVTADTARSLSTADVAIVLDTNDSRLTEPLASSLTDARVPILFIDHHPLLESAPPPNQSSWIDRSAASTGELVYKIIRSLLEPNNFDLDVPIARALYTSIAFDTHLFRYVRSSPTSHRIAADLLKLEIDAEAIHRALFSTYTVAKLNFLTRALQRVEFHDRNQTAFIYLPESEFKDVARDDSGEVVDMIMNVESLAVAALVREDESGVYKISLRSKGDIAVLPLAEIFGGGGHRVAAGAYVSAQSFGTIETIRSRILVFLSTAVEDLERTSKGNVS